MLVQLSTVDIEASVATLHAMAILKAVIFQRIKRTPSPTAQYTMSWAAPWITRCSGIPCITSQGYICIRPRKIKTAAKIMRKDCSG